MNSYLNKGIVTEGFKIIRALRTMKKQALTITCIVGVVNNKYLKFMAQVLHGYRKRHSTTYQYDSYQYIIQLRSTLKV